jgi:hypothetical protein
MALLLVTSLQLLVGAWSVHPHYSHENVMVVEIFGKDDAWDVFTKAYGIAGQVIQNAVANGIPADVYEEQFNKQVLLPNAYRISIALEIGVHAVIYYVFESKVPDILKTYPEFLCKAINLDVLTAGDVNVDGVVNLMDLALLGKAWHSKPGDPNWNPLADFNCDSKVDLVDQGMMGQHYGNPSMHANPIDIEMRPESRYQWLPD